MSELVERIKVLGQREHSKASEAYLDVEFYYPDVDVRWVGSVPYEYRRTGVSAETDEQKTAVLEDAYEAMHPGTATAWLAEQKIFWDTSNKETTRPFFEALKGGKWTCRQCGLPQNPNWARRTQDIKELGYTIATDTSRFCNQCKCNTTQLIMLRLPRGGTTGYETWSATLRARIVKVLDHYDVYENARRQASLLPDHKFPEIRWDESTREENPDSMSDSEIRAKFQLLTNQRNQQKREVCRRCFQTGERGAPFGIPFFFQGGPKWPSDVPKIGKAAEKGCLGCGWYDMAEWRKRLAAKV